MPALVPSQVVKFIVKNFSSTDLNGTKPMSVSPDRAGSLNALIKLVDEIPSVLLPSDPLLYAELVQCIEAIRFAVKKAELRDDQSNFQFGEVVLQPSAKGEPNPVECIRRALEQCPDQITPADSRELSFIKGAEVRSELLRDLEGTRSSLLHSDWKAATVIAGSIVEALLLWGIEQSDRVKVQNSVPFQLHPDFLQLQHAALLQSAGSAGNGQPESGRCRQAG